MYLCIVIYCIIFHCTVYLCPSHCIIVIMAITVYFILFTDIQIDDDFSVSYAYGAYGQLKMVNVNFNHKTVLYDVLYDEAGRVKTKFYISAQTDYDYNPLTGRLISLQNKFRNGTLTSEYHLDYDHSGRVVAMNTSQGNWEYRYDINGQLSSWKISDESQTDIVYNSRGKRVSAASASGQSSCVTNKLGQYTSCGSDHYEWDLNGNLKSVHRDAVKIDANEYDELNRLVSSKESGYEISLSRFSFDYFTVLRFSS